MKKLILCLLLATFSNVIFASFPVNDIGNKKEIVPIFYYEASIKTHS